MTSIPVPVSSRTKRADPSVGFSGWLQTSADGILASLLLYTPLLATTLLAKLSVPPFAAQSLSISYLFILLAVAVGLVLGYLRMDTGRLSFFLIFIGCIGTVHVLRGDLFSLASMLLLVTLYIAYVFYIPNRNDSSERALRFFLGLATFLALTGIAQYAIQLTVGSRYAFPIESFVPGPFLVQGFHMQAPVTYGGSTLRINGVFFSEPSFFSQFMAVAIIIELLTRNRLQRVALYALALFLSYSGTGFMLLAVCLPLILVTRRHWGLFWLAVGALVLFVALGSYLDLDKLTGRIGEFGSVRSSAYARFIAGFHMFDQYLWPYPLKALFGYGAGQFPEFALRMPFAVAEMTLFKMVFEYGLLGAALYFSFIFYCVFRSGAPFIARLAIAMTLFLNGPFVPFFHGLALSLLVWTTKAGDDKTQPPALKPFLADGA